MVLLLSDVCELVLASGTQCRHFGVSHQGLPTRVVVVVEVMPNSTVPADVGTFYTQSTPLHSPSPSPWLMCSGLQDQEHLLPSGHKKKDRSLQLSPLEPSEAAHVWLCEEVTGEGVIVQSNFGIECEE